mmetsp:Transcript_44237/g.127870  ORF Transcript_44237/g.127870 Transcript_44237/m.127870 type:complete len:263 (-) Transcript_44237:60-848(-)
MMWARRPCHSPRRHVQSRARRQRTHLPAIPHPRAAATKTPAARGGAQPMRAALRGLLRLWRPRPASRSCHAVRDRRPSSVASLMPRSSPGCSAPWRPRRWRTRRPPAQRRRRWPGCSRPSLRRRRCVPRPARRSSGLARLTMLRSYGSRCRRRRPRAGGSGSMRFVQRKVGADSSTSSWRMPRLRRTSLPSPGSSAARRRQLPSWRVRRRPLCPRMSSPLRRGRHCHLCRPPLALPPLPQPLLLPPPLPPRRPLRLRRRRPG